MSYRTEQSDIFFLRLEKEVKKRREAKKNNHILRYLRRRLFISYAPEDVEIVRSFSRDLRRVGVNIWFDEKEVADGSDVLGRVAEALATCHGVVSFQSANYWECKTACFELNLFEQISRIDRDIYTCFVFRDAEMLPEEIKGKPGVIELFSQTGIEAAHELASQVGEHFREKTEWATKTLAQLIADAGGGKNIFLSGDPEDGAIGFGIHEDMKSYGLTVTGRSGITRSHDIAPEELAELIEVHDRHLARLKSPDPVTVVRRLFLSYASEEADIVRQFARDLREHGVDTWLDEEDIADHHNWIEELYQALSVCCGFIRFESPNCLQSRVVKAELSFRMQLMEVREGLFFALVYPYKGDFKTEFEGNEFIFKLFERPSSEVAKGLVDVMNRFYYDYAERVRLSGLSFAPEQTDR